MKNSTSNDYIAEVVPQEARQSWFHVLIVWLGFVLVVGIMSVGGGLAAQMTREDLFASIIIGNFVLALVAAATAYIGARSGSHSLVSS